jgi:protein-disulfide isomerase
VTSLSALPSCSRPRPRPQHRSPTGPAPARSTRALLAVVGLALLVPARADADRKWFDPTAVYAVEVGASPTRGPADAPITIVEWSDYACRYCNRARRTLANVERLYGDKIRWVYRHLPLDEDDTTAAEAGLAAAAQGAFWPMHDRLFAVHGQVDRAGVEMLAGELGLDLTRFRGDLDAAVHRAQILDDEADALALGVTGTPTFFVNGRPLRGAQPLGVFVRVIEEELARAEAALAAGTAADRLYEHLVGGGRASADVDDEEDYAPPELDPTAVYQVGLGLDGHVQGPADALVTIVEWSDFQCPFCAENAPNLVRLREEYGDRIRLVFRHMPLPNHPEAQLAAEAAVAAAAQGKFWEMHERLFGAQQAMSRADLEAHGEAIGLDMTAFRAALDERRHRDAVADDAAAGSALGIGGTPTIFVNGAPIEGAADWEHLKLTVEARLMDAQSLVAAGIEPADVYAVIMTTAERAERGDPSRMPRTARGARLELRQDDRVTAIEAACRGRDAARAGKMAGKLKGKGKARAKATCEAYGIDL